MNKKQIIEKIDKNIFDKEHYYREFIDFLNNLNISDKNIDTIIKEKNFENSHQLINSDIPFFDFFLPNFPINDIKREAENLLDLFVSHRSGRSKGWKSIVLHGLEWNKTQNYKDYEEYRDIITNENIPYKWTKISNICKITKQYFTETFYFEKYHRLRFMVLEPNGYIMPHNDMDIHRLAALNVAVTQPEECYFFFDNYGILPFEPGKGIMLNLINKHCLVNLSKEYRIHMILHGKYGFFIENFLYNEYKKRIGKI